MALKEIRESWNSCPERCASKLPVLRKGKIGQILYCTRCDTWWECRAGAVEKTYTHPGSWRATIGRFWRASKKRP